MQHASYQRRKLAGLTSERGYSFWPTPTFKSSGNRVCIQPVTGGVKLLKDETQSGKQLGLTNAAQSWVLMWDLLMALGWTPQAPACSLPFRVLLRNGGAPLTPALTLNPRFTDWMMGWPPGWTEPLQPVTAWSLWLQRARGAC